MNHSWPWEDGSITGKQSRVKMDEILYIELIEYLQLVSNKETN